jgi:hypothetical protein
LFEIWENNTTNFGTVKKGCDMKKHLLVVSLLVLSVSAFAANSEEELIDANKKVTEFLNSTSMARTRTYCVEDKDDCRILVQRVDKLTGKLSKSFYDIFQSRDRKVTSICFSIYDEATKSYAVYSDLTADADIVINQILSLNKNVKITFDRSNYPTIHNLVLSKLGTTNGVLGTLSFSSKGSSVDGHLIELATPEVLGNAVHIDYKLIR